MLPDLTSSFYKDTKPLSHNYLVEKLTLETRTLVSQGSDLPSLIGSQDFWFVQLLELILWLGTKPHLSIKQLES